MKYEDAKDEYQITVECLESLKYGKPYIGRNGIVRPTQANIRYFQWLKALNEYEMQVVKRERKKSWALIIAFVCALILFLWTVM